MPATVVVAVKGGITKGCTPPGTEPARWSRSPVAQARASARVLVIFQLVPIQKGDMQLLRREGPRGSWRRSSSTIRTTSLVQIVDELCPGAVPVPRCGARHGPAGRNEPARSARVSSLLEGAVVGADRVDLRRGAGLGVELEAQPHLHQLLS